MVHSCGRVPCVAALGSVDAARLAHGSYLALALARAGGVCVARFTCGFIAQCMDGGAGSFGVVGWVYAVSPAALMGCVASSMAW